MTLSKESERITVAACPVGLPKGRLKEMLSPAQYRVLKENGTEQPFANAYWDNKKEGIYVDPISGAPLFSSKDKFDSGTGWPSFSRPLENAQVIERYDTSHGMLRREARSRTSDAHLGHVFDDGPLPTNKRYCINSAALRFIGVEKLEEEGYGEYLALFGREPRVRKTQVATFGAGCFWGVQAAFQKVPGVFDTRAGFMGGRVSNPTYEKVCSNTTGHAEVVQVVYDPSKVSYGELLKVFWGLHDPTSVNRQGPDIGSQYRSVIFYHMPDQQKAALASKAALESSGVFQKPIATEILPAKEFWEAEDYHQNYYKKSSLARQ